MKRFNLIFRLLLIVLLSACSTGDDGTDSAGGNTGNNASILNGYMAVRCEQNPNLQGAGAAYWDQNHGVFIPLPEVPIISNPSFPQFVHSQFPLLGLTIPQGYTASEILINQTATIGVNVVRNDNGVRFTWIPNTQSPGENTTLIFDVVNETLNSFGFGGTPIIECSTNVSTTEAGIPISFNARFFRFGNMTAIAWVRSAFVGGTTFSAIQIAAAPTAEYDRETLETFLPFNFQLFVRPDGEFTDKDGDGVSSIEDQDDCNANIPNPQG